MSPFYINLREPGRSPQQLNLLAGLQPTEQAYQPDFNKALYGLSGLASLYGNFANASGQRLNLQQTQQMPMGLGQPSYSGAALNSALNAKPQGMNAGEIGNSALTGAATGFATAGPVGAVVGGVIGGIGSAISGAFRGNQEDTEKNRALEAQHAYQQQYNSASNSYQQRNDAITDYDRRLNRNAYNLSQY